MARAVSAEVSAFYEACHRDRRRRDSLRRGRQGVARRRRASTASRRRTAGSFDCDVVIVGIGIVPNVELAAARRARSATTASSSTSSRARPTRTSSLPAIARTIRTPLLGRRVRLESVPNAIHQAKVAAATLLGAPTPYSEVPWFWSDQYDLKLQIAGLSTGYDEVVRARRPRRAELRRVLPRGRPDARRRCRQQPARFHDRQEAGRGRRAHLAATCFAIREPISRS